MMKAYAVLKPNDLYFLNIINEFATKDAFSGKKRLIALDLMVGIMKHHHITPDDIADRLQSS